MNKIRPRDILITWLITLVLSFVLFLLVTADIEVAGAFVLLAGFFSLSYVVIAMVLTIWIKAFWPFQIIHLIIASATALVVYIVDINFVSWLSWAAWPYFILGALVQYGWLRNKVEKTEAEPEETHEI